ncbi:MAG TPA: ferredoxin [Firmicutes bacterium]|nr:ferredoxin [Bacillota bacterium]HBT17285.1 ferredoxin [Bacillota bacterium]
MKTTVDPELCIACGLCISTCPEVYDWDEEEGKAKALKKQVPEDQESCAQEAADQCPTDAIAIS